MLLQSLLAAKTGNPYAIYGAALGGYTAGFLMGDQELVFPEDMIAIPARQEYLLSGAPDLKILIRGGETLLPTGGNVRDVQEAIGEANDQKITKKKRKKLNSWQRYLKTFQYRNKRKSESGREYGSARMKAASRAFKKEGRKK